MVLSTSHALLQFGSMIFEILFVAAVLVVPNRACKVADPMLRLGSVLYFGKLVVSPPKAAKFILLLVPKRHREHLIGDLEEEYTTIVLPEYGTTQARLWYWWQVAISVAPLVWTHIMRAEAIAWLWKRVR